MSSTPLVLNDSILRAGAPTVSQAHIDSLVAKSVQQARIGDAATASVYSSLARANQEQRELLGRGEQPAQANRPDLPRLQEEAVVLAEKARQVQTLPQGGLTAVLEKTSSYLTFAKNWVENFSRHRQGREDLLPMYFIWTLLRACNFRCSYCDDHKGRMYPDLPKDGVLNTEQGKKLLTKLRTGLSAVYYAGGEPTMRKDLPQLMRHATELRYFPQIINTNGSLLDRRLQDKSWSNFLADIDIVVVSLDSLDLQKLKKMYVYKKPEDVIRNILMLRELRKEYNFKLMINCVITPETLDDAMEVLDFANALGITFCPVPQNDRAHIMAGLLDNQKYRHLAKTILERYRQGYPVVGSYRMNERLLFNAPLHCRNTLKPHVDHDGRVFWPCKASANVEPMMLDVLDDANGAAVAELWDRAGRLLSPSGFHGQGPEQCGGDCNWAQNRTTELYLAGLENPWEAVRDVMGFVNKSVTKRK